MFGRDGLRSAVIALCLTGFTAHSQAQQVLARHDDAFRSLLAEFSTRVSFQTSVAVADTAPRKGLDAEAFFKLALERNPKLKAEAASVAGALQDLEGARSRYWPQLKLETSGSLVGNPIGPVSVTAGQFGAFNGTLFPPRDVLLYKGQESTYYSFKMILDQPLVTWGKLPLGVQLGEKGVALAETKRRKAEHELRVETKTLYDALSCLLPLEKALTLQDSIGSRLLTLTDESEKKGFVTKAKLLETRVKLRQISLALAEARNKREGVVARLAAIAGLDVLPLGDLAIPSPPAGLPALPEDKARAMAASSHSIRLLEGLVEVKESLAAMAKIKAEILPDIGLRAELSYAGPRFPLIETDWLRQDDWQLYVSIGTQGSLFDKVKAGDAAKALIERESAKADLEEARRSIDYFLRETYLSLELSRAKLEYTQLKLDAARNMIAEKRLLMDAGAGPETDFLESLVEALGTLAEGYGHLADYRAALGKVAGVLGKD